MDFEANLGHHQSVILCVSRRCRRSRIALLQQFVCVKGYIMKARLKFCFLNQMVRSVQNVPSISACKLAW